MYKNLQAEQARKNMTNQQVADYLHISTKRKQENL